MISTENKRNQYAGNGSTTAFAYSFRILDEDDLLVVLQSAAGADTVQTITTHYTVSGVGDEGGGTVTMVTAPASGETLSIIQDAPATQLTDYATGDGFPAAAHEDALDNAVNAVKRARDLADRSLALQDGDVTGSGQYAAGGNKITGLGSGSADTDAATIANVDAKIALAALGPTGVADLQQLDTRLTAAEADIDALEAIDANTRLNNLGTRTSALETKLDNFYSVATFGAVGDGVTNDESAFASAAAAASAGGYEIYVADTGSDYVVTNQPDINLFWGPGNIVVNGVNGYIKPSPGMAEAIYASEFRIPKLASSDAQPLLQVAVNLAQSLDIPLHLEPRAVYHLDSTLVIPQGRVNGEVFADTREFTLFGNYAELRPQFNGICVDVQPVCSLADAAISGAYKLGQFHIQDLNFNFASANASSFHQASALQIGRAGYTMRSTEPSIVRNVRIKDRNQENFTVNAVQIVNASMIRFDSLTVVAGGVSITNTDNDTEVFTGDMWFNDCDLRGVNEDGKRPIHIFGNNVDTTVTANIAAIWFSHCEVYEGGCKIEAAAGDRIRRVWFNGVHFAETEAGHRVVEVEVTDAGATNPGFMDEIVFNNCLFPQQTSGGAAAGRMLHMTNNAATTLKSVQIVNNRFRDAQPFGGDVEVIYLENVDHVQILGNTFDNMQMTGAVITAENCDGLMVQGNMVPSFGGLFPANTHLVELGANSDEWIIVGNAAAISGTGAMANSSAGSGTVANNQTLTT